MRELASRDVRHRVRGLPALERRARALVVALYRFGEHQAKTRDEHQRCARLIDAVLGALENRKDSAR